jgi:hypothetical protein
LPRFSSRNLRYGSAIVLAAEHPGLRPILTAMCSVAGCELALLRIPERLSIEGDEMIVDDRRRPGGIRLIVGPCATARLSRWRSPSLELSPA